MRFWACGLTPAARCYHRFAVLSSLRGCVLLFRREALRFDHLHDKGELSEGELCALLRCDRVTAREIVDGHLTMIDVSDEGEVRQIQPETQYSLLSEAK